MINLHERMGLGWDRTLGPWTCSQTRICCQTVTQTRFRLRYAARISFLYKFLWCRTCISCCMPLFGGFISWSVKVSKLCLTATQLSESARMVLAEVVLSRCQTYAMYQQKVPVLNFCFKKDTNTINLVSLTSARVDTCSSVSYVSYPQTEKSAMCMGFLAFL